MSSRSRQPREDKRSSHAGGVSFEGHKGHHDVFHRDPFISVEVHESVLDHQRETGLDTYFAPPWQLTDGNGFEYNFDPSDNYIFLWVICSVISIRAESASDSLPIWRSI